jgi:hypothetical protein
MSDIPAFGIEPSVDSDQRLDGLAAGRLLLLATNQRRAMRGGRGAHDQRRGSRGQRGLSQYFLSDGQAQVGADGATSPAAGSGAAE